MKQMIITIAALTVGARAAILLISRSIVRKTCRSRMSFAELYEDNLCGEMSSLFD